MQAVVALFFAIVVVSAVSADCELNSNTYPEDCVRCKPDTDEVDGASHVILKCTNSSWKEITCPKCVNEWHECMQNTECTAGCDDY
ncbi:hypothetical protein AAVH_20681 [Aphelenchoides avenae]|nr:hypothetical protein AAVH_20681 [Aphelenchus avenae]